MFSIHGLDCVCNITKSYFAIMWVNHLTPHYGSHSFEWVFIISTSGKDIWMQQIRFYVYEKNINTKGESYF